MPMRWAFIHALVIVLAWSLSAGALNADQEVLLDFIDSVPGLPSSWSANNIANYCNWPGIKCNNSAVIEIRMTGQAFADVYRGQIPSSIHKMQSLQEFSTNLINLGGTIPPEIFSLPTLTTLEINHGLISGTIPPEIGNCTSLRKLSLYLNTLEGTLPETIKNLINLEYLNVRGNRINGTFPAWILEMPSLNSLQLYDNLLTCPESFDTLTALNAKNLTQCDIRMLPFESEGNTICGEPWPRWSPCAVLPLKRLTLERKEETNVIYTDNRVHVETRHTSIYLYAMRGNQPYRHEYFEMDLIGFSERYTCTEECNYPLQVVEDVPLNALYKIESDNPRVIKLRSDLTNGAHAIVTLDFEKLQGEGIKWSYNLVNWPFAQSSNFVAAILSMSSRAPHSMVGEFNSFDGGLFHCVYDGTKFFGNCSSNITTGEAFLIPTYPPKIRFDQLCQNTTRFFFEFETDFTTDGIPNIFLPQNVFSLAYTQPYGSVVHLEKQIYAGLTVPPAPLKDQFTLYMINIYFPSFQHEMVYDPSFGISIVFDVSNEVQNSGSGTNAAVIAAAVIVPIVVVCAAAIAGVLYWRQKNKYKSTNNVPLEIRDTSDTKSASPTPERKWRTANKQSLRTTNVE